MLADAYQEASRLVAQRNEMARAAQAATAALTAEVAPLPDIVEWIEREFYIPERLNTDNPAMQIQPYQKVVLREALRRDENGKLVYDLLLWSDIKKSAKSSIAAAMVLYRAVHTPWSSHKIVANDLKQANSRVFYYIQRAIELNPRLRSRAALRNYKIAFDNRATIEAVPVDPSGEAGANDDTLSFTELHAASSKASVKMWSEMTIPPTKHGQAMRIIDTYAGFTGEAPILEPLYHECVKPENRLHLPGAPNDLEVYASGRILCLWNTQPRMPWQTPDYYASEAKILPPNEFARMHRNTWGSSTEVFVPPAWWDACRVELPALDKYRQLVVSLDAAVSGDCFGMVALSRHGNKVAQRYARAWVPPLGGKLQYANPLDPTDRDYPEGELRWLIQNYNVIAVIYDPYQLHDFCTRLSEQNLAYFVDMGQGAPRLVADKQFYDFIRDQRYLHDGHATMTAHVTNANREAAGEKLRIVKRAPEAKIDLAVCASMATQAAMEYLPE